MNSYFSSDLHFYHKNVIRFCNRPYDSVDHMNEMLLDNINACVKSNDMLYTLGDFSFSNIEDTISILKRINCKNHYMILGNHDKAISKNKGRLLAEGLVKEIVDYKELYIDKQFICLFHYPQRTWNKSHYGSWQLFGHVHGSMPPLGKSVDVGVDSTFILGEAPYRPFAFDEIRNFMKTQE